jgi:7,8-dihydroneopterin aldolase/epimerase/oxygenase
VTLEIELHGLVVHGFHGVLEEERRDGQQFVFDVRVTSGEAAARTDDVEDAVDYRLVASTVVEVSSRQRYHLLEALASAVADELVRRFPVERVRVRVRKPAVRLAARVDYAAVTVERMR